MPQTEVRPWWADVQHLRESVERRAGPDRSAGTERRPAAPAQQRRSTATERRTVTITGHPALMPARAKLVEVERRRPARPPVERVGHRPDRIAMWAVLLGFFLILVAAASAAHL